GCSNLKCASHGQLDNGRMNQMEAAGNESDRPIPGNPYQTPVSIDADLLPESPSHPFRQSLFRISVACFLVGLGLGLFFAILISSLVLISVREFLAITFFPAVLGGLLALAVRTIFYAIELLPWAYSRLVR
ncbi:MAG: hypothetical protein AAF497_23950, partial [Planctomycetota bacterium]